MTNKLYERKISFVDLNKERVNLEIEIRDNNQDRYPFGELSIRSQSWQWKFVPDGEDQEALLKIWNGYHLNGMSAGTEKQNDILKKTNASDDYGAQCEELRNYDFNGEPIWNIDRKLEFLKKEKEYGKLRTYADRNIQNFPTDNLSAIFDIDRGKLIKYGCVWVIKDLPEDLPNTIDTLCDSIEEDMKCKTLVSDFTYEEFLEKYEFNHPEKVYALACNRWGYLESLENVDEHSPTSFHFEWNDWLVCTDEEANDDHLEYIKSIVDEMWFNAFRENSVSTSTELDQYGDVVISKSILIPQNERDSALNSYNGYEYDINVNGTTYYIYQR